MKKILVIGFSVFMLTAVSAETTDAAKDLAVSKKKSAEPPIPTLQTEAAKVIEKQQNCELIKAHNNQQGLECEKSLKQQSESNASKVKEK